MFEATQPLKKILDKNFTILEGVGYTLWVHDVALMLKHGFLKYIQNHPILVSIHPLGPDIQGSLHF